MRIGIASGKGGTGKTTVATNLARVAVQENRSVVYLDCDVEEPNGQIFLRPEVKWRRPVTLPVPRVDAVACDNCGLCGEICSSAPSYASERKCWSSRNSATPAAVAPGLSRRCHRRGPPRGRT